MKVAVPKEISKVASKILLPLEEDQDEAILTKSNSVSYDPRTIPNNAASPTHRCLARVLEGVETPRQILKWRADITKAAMGLNATTFAAMKPVAESMMRSAPLAIFHSCLAAEAQAHFEAEVEAAPEQDPANPDNADKTGVLARGVDASNSITQHIYTALNFVVQQLLPHQVLARVKRNVRREMRKPAGMKVRAYYQALLCINLEEITALPPFWNNQQLSDDELLDVLLFGAPKSWQKEMEKQGYDPMAHPLNEAVDFLENIESSKDFDGTKVETKKKSASTKNKSKGSSSSGEHYCMLHGKGNHSTEDCVKLKAEAKRLKSNSSGKKSSGGKSNDKSWDDKASKAAAKAKAKSDLATLVKRQVKMTIKDLKAADKKRKSSGDDSSYEANAVDLEAFNYARKMEELSINSDSEVDV